MAFVLLFVDKVLALCYNVFCKQSVSTLLTLFLINVLSHGIDFVDYEKPGATISSTGVPVVKRLVVSAVVTLW